MSIWCDNRCNWRAAIEVAKVQPTNAVLEHREGLGNEWMLNQLSILSVRRGMKSCPRVGMRHGCFLGARGKKEKGSGNIRQACCSCQSCACDSALSQPLCNAHHDASFLCSQLASS